MAYQGPETDDTTCTHHPGTPVFHEGLKFWSCCNKRTTDFNAFLSQVGCSLGKHKWTKEVTMINDKRFVFFNIYDSFSEVTIVNQMINDSCIVNIYVSFPPGY